MPAIPMRQPEMETLVLCPVCRQKTRKTVEICPHCGAERLFGPTGREALTNTLAGAVAVPLFVAIVAGPSVWDVPLAVAGALAGFFFAQMRHGGDRWLSPG